MNLLAYIVFFIGFLDFTAGLYEDQSGKFDWHQRYIGNVDHLAFDQCRQGSCKRAIVGTDQNVLASLDMQNGEIEWRQVLEREDRGRIDDFIVINSNILVALGGGSSLRCYSATMGSLNWEFAADSGDIASSAKLRIIDHNDDILLILLAGSSVYALDKTGKRKWSKELPSGDGVRYSHLSIDNGHIHIVGVSLKSHVTVTTLKPDASLLPKTTTTAAWLHQNTKCEIAGNQFICLDPDNNILHQLNFANPDSFKSSLLQDLGVECDNPVLSSNLDTQGGELTIKCRNAVLLVKASSSGFKLIKSITEIGAIQVMKYGDNPAFITMIRTKADECEIRGYDLDSGSEFSEIKQTVTFMSHHGTPLQILGFLKKREGSPLLRLLVISEDNSLILVEHNSKLAWVREEALAKIITVDMVDLPVSPILAKMEEEFGSETNDIVSMFGRRLRTQFAQLQAFLYQVASRLRAHKHEHYSDDEIDTDEDDDDDYLFRDEFNLKKIILVATEVGKIYGIYSSTGRILWRHLLTEMVPFEATGKKQFIIAIQRTTSHFPHDPQGIILGKHKNSGLGMLYQFHPVSGLPLDDTPPGGLILNYKVKQSMLLSQMDEHFLRPLVVVDSNLKVHVYPPSSSDMVRTLVPSLFLMISDTQSSHLTGYSLVDHREQDLVAQEVWNLNLATEPQKITNIAYKRANEHVHSQGIVLADRSVLYKYLNPNLVVITAEGQENTDKGFFNVYLVDAVTGQLIFHCNHKRVKGPVNIVHSENWIVYNYWNQRHRRNEIAVLELYEGKKQSNATSFSSLYPPPLPMVLRQAYIFSAHISALATTITEKGMTNKHVLMAMTNGGIIEMQKALLDPRRPDIPTQEHREEGIIPYIPELPRANEAVINYYKSVLLVRGIHTAPAGLESHSMVFVYGLDLFYTRVMPSKMFDVLKEDFDYFFIGSVTLGMILVSFITKKLAARKALNRSWN